MSKFQDNKDRNWIIDIRVSTARKVLKETGVDLLDISSYETVFSSTLSLIEILLVLTKEQRHERGITEEDFVDSLAGDAAVEAVGVLIDGVVEMFPEEQKKMLKIIVQHLRESHKRQSEAMSRALGKLSGNAPESSE